MTSRFPITRQKVMQYEQGISGHAGRDKISHPARECLGFPQVKQEEVIWEDVWPTFLSYYCNLDPEKQQKMDGWTTGAKNINIFLCS